ncbi:MAG: hypothetical protein HC809_13420, partial [Gammaproteobacteria bacterium]|nr:hypothetical protein [Gammaproteobacteria bacterium]
ARPRATNALEQWLAGWRGALAMAALAGVAIVIGLTVQTPVPDETVRGIQAPATELFADDPAAMRLAIIESLADAGVEASGYALLNIEFVEATLPQPVPPSVERVLARYGIPLPVDGAMRVAIAGRRDERRSRRDAGGAYARRHSGRGDPTAGSVR